MGGVDRYLFSLLIICTCILLFVSHAGAQELITWQECLKEASAHHPNLIAAREAIKVEKAQRGIAISAHLPQITTELSHSRSHSVNGETSEAAAYGITAKQLLFDGLKTPYGIAAATSGVRAAEYNYRTAAAEVRFRLHSAFAELLKSQQLVTITDEILARRRQNAELVALLYEGGREHKGSLLTSQANLAQAESEARQALRLLELSQRRLSKELGRIEHRPLRAVGALEVDRPSGAPPDLEAIAAHHPSLEAIAAKREGASFALKAAKAELFPSIYATASAVRVDSSWPPQQDAWSVGVTLTLPLFEGGRRWANISKARAYLRQLEAEERKEKEEVLVSLKDAWTSWQDALDTVLVKKGFLHAYEERAQIARAQYENGLISFDTWTIIEDALVQAKKALLDAQYAAAIAEAAWIKAKGLGVEDAQ